MELRRIGSLEVSAVGLGCNNFGMRVDVEGTQRVVDAAITAGINFFDTADIYGGTKSEEYLGQVLGPRRKDILLATKFGMEVSPEKQGAAPAYVKAACEDSLRRLQTDYIDLYWLHRPDPAVPIADTLGALKELIDAGKVREIGCSNFNPAQLREAAAAAQSSGSPRFVGLQNEFSLIHLEPELPEDGGENRNGTLAECQRLDIGFVPYFPLASGLLSGKYRAGQPAPEGTRLATSPRGAQYLTPERLDLVERLIAWSEARGHSILELAISWLLAQPAVSSVISGATRPEQVQANAKAGAWQLSASEVAEVRAILQGGSSAAG